MKSNVAYKTTQLTPAQMNFAHEYAKTDNAAHSVRVAYPQTKGDNYIRVKGHRLLMNSNVIMEIEAQKTELEAISSRAVHRIGDLVDSEKEAIALDASKYAIDRVHGKPKQQVELKSQHVLLTIDLTGGEAGEVPQHILDELAS